MRRSRIVISCLLVLLVGSGCERGEMEGRESQRADGAVPLPTRDLATLAADDGAWRAPRSSGQSSC